MEPVIDLLSWVLLAAGGFFLLASGIGVLRLPDVFTRLHASGMTDTMGAALTLTGLMLQAGLSLVTVKLLLIWVFLWLTSPVATHALARAALDHGRLRPVLAPEEAPKEAAPGGEAAPDAGLLAGRRRAGAP